MIENTTSELADMTDTSRSVFKVEYATGELQAHQSENVIIE